MQKKEKILKVLGEVYPVRNNAPLEFLTGFTKNK